MANGKEASGTNTTSNSAGASKATSDAGGDSASDLNANDGKKHETLEEKAERYRKARMRIFGVTGDSEAAQALPDALEAENDASRSSSANGKKKKKRQPNYSDDGFEARSQYTVAPSYPGNAYSGEGVVYGPMPSMMTSPQFQPAPVNNQMQTSYGSGYAYPQMMQQDGQNTMMWSPNSYSSYGFEGQNYYGQSTSNDYELASSFNRGMQFQSTPTPSQAMPNMSPQMGGYGQYQPTYQQQQYGQPAYNRPMSSGQSATPGPYAYGQLPHPYQNGYQQNNNHPIPGSYNRQQFNPQSQAFIPGGGRTPMMQQQMPYMHSQAIPNYTNYQMPNLNQRTTPQTSHQSPFGSPRLHQSNTPSSFSRSTSNQGQTSTLPHIQQPLAHPLPQPPNPESSIAKWGTPAHLPAKPPAPESMAPQKYYEVNKTMPIASHHTFPGFGSGLGAGLPRIPSQDTMNSIAHGPGK